MNFLKAVALPSDPKTKEIVTMTGQKLGWLKHDHEEWAFVASGSSARLNIDLLNEISILIKAVS